MGEGLECACLYTCLRVQSCIYEAVHTGLGELEFTHPSDLMLLATETKCIAQGDGKCRPFFKKANCQFSSWAKVNSALAFF